LQRDSRTLTPDSHQPVRVHPASARGIVSRCGPFGGASSTSTLHATHWQPPSLE
jgi:hypothetical protein